MTASYFMADLVADNLSAKVDVEWVDAVLYTPYHLQQALLYEVNRMFVSRFSDSEGSKSSVARFCNH